MSVSLTVSLNGRVAIVTGGGRGIGEEYSKVLAGAGAKVVVADIQEDNARQVAAAIKDAGGEALALKVDVGDEADTKKMARDVVDTFGGIDILVNNAAIFHSMRRDPLLEVPVDYWTRFMHVNVTGVLLCTQACAPYMKTRGWGRVINQSSVAAYQAGNHYNISKLAVVGLTIGLAQELGPYNITVNAIAPGQIGTEAMVTLVPGRSVEEWEEQVLSRQILQRGGTTQDIAGLLLFLASEAADWMTGQTIAMDGGRHIKRL